MIPRILLLSFAGASAVAVLLMSLQAAGMLGGVAFLTVTILGFLQILRIDDH